MGALEAVDLKPRQGQWLFSKIVIAIPFVVILLILGAILKQVPLLEQGYEDAFASAKGAIAYGVARYMPGRMRLGEFAGMLLDSPNLRVELRINGRIKGFTVREFKRCLDYKTGICSSQLVINQGCLQKEIEKIVNKDRKWQDYRYKKQVIRIPLDDFVYDTGNAAKNLKEKLEGMFRRLCVDLRKGDLQEKYKVSASVQAFKDRPQTSGKLASRYAEIDYSRQLLFLWNNGKFEKFVISGPANQNYSLGVFKIYSKSQLAWSEAYRAWMPYWLGYSRDKYTGLGIGIHALTYTCRGYAKYCSPRARVYESSRNLGQPVSDGCVRLSNKDAQKVFNVLQKGDLVVVHK